MTEIPLAELVRIRRVADQSCSAHARLRDRYAARATALDLTTLAASAWILALAFVDPAIAAKLTPPKIPPNIWTGLMGVATFVSVLVQLKLDPKRWADAHQRAFHVQAEIKQAAADAERVSGDPALLTELRVALAAATTVGVSIPENEFLRQKRIHLRKVALSRHLDDHPFASTAFLGIAWWWRDNLGGGRAAVPLRQAGTSGDEVVAHRKSSTTP